MKKEQNLQNHRRLVPSYHYITYSMLLILLIFTFKYAVQNKPMTEFPTILMAIFAVSLLFVAFFARSFAIKAQDRAIRAEENFRYYLMTGQRLPSELRLGQIIALRFASDEEYIDLMKRAIAENLKQKDIKAAIKNWKGDYHRV